MQEEIKFAIRKVKNGKALGPDSIRNENLKLLFKGKGDAEDVNAYTGVSQPQLHAL